MTSKTKLKTAIIGSVTAAVCCFGPALVMLLGAVGTSAWLAWFGYVLVPALAIFLGITACALIHRVRGTANGPRSRESLP